MHTALFWFRRDLRLRDNVGLFHALQTAERVYCVFVFDRAILDVLPRADRRVEFIWESVRELGEALHAAGGHLIVRHAVAKHELPRLADTLGAEAVFANHDYEPAAVARDAAVADALQHAGRVFRTFKDSVIFEKSEVLTRTGTPYTVFTPYKKAWLGKLGELPVEPYSIDDHLHRLARPAHPTPPPTLDALGFARTNLRQLMPVGASGGETLLADFAQRIDAYQVARDYPAIKGVSYLGVHNRFGTVSIRELARFAHTATLRRDGAGAHTWLGELIWRDFFFQVLWHHPHAAHAAFKPEYDALRWENDESLFAAWCEARTGYPIVDAAMRQLHETGYMHNRLRMIVASFLTKDLLIDWRRGEAHFARHLNDFDLAANNGGWQWAASTGCDAQPYFRIFHPVTQSQRFDPEGKFIRRYLPELARVPLAYLHAPWTMPPVEQAACGVAIGRDYPASIVDHAVQREKALAMYKAVRSKAAPA